MRLSEATLDVVDAHKAIGEDSDITDGLGCLAIVEEGTINASELSTLNSISFIKASRVYGVFLFFWVKVETSAEEVDMSLKHASSISIVSPWVVPS